MNNITMAYRGLFSFMSKYGGREYGVIMKLLFHEVRDLGLFYLIVPLYMASILQVTSWSKMAALPPAHTLKFKLLGLKEWKRWCKRSAAADFSGRFHLSSIGQNLETWPQL